jgi:RimJ/RimL family protein N-acetyltransferase
MIPLLETPRLALREWRESDTGPFAEINQDPAVMQFFPAPLSRAQTVSYIDDAKAHFRRHGVGKWALELKETKTLIGCIGIDTVDFDAPWRSIPEIGWRLSSRYWGKGYAPEAAACIVSFMFEEEACPEIVAFTAVSNRQSRRVMEKIGMAHDMGADFDHPKLPAGHRLSRHVLYRIRNVSA